MESNNDLLSKSDMTPCLLLTVAAKKMSQETINQRFLI
jgi:hypothetical protein